MQAVCFFATGKNALTLATWKGRTKEGKAASFGERCHHVWRRHWHPTPVLLPGKSHRWRSLVVCSSWDREESDRTQWLHFHFSLSCIGEGNGNPFQCSCLENPGDGGAWWAAVYGVAQSRIRLKWLSSSSHHVTSCFCLSKPLCQMPKGQQQPINSSLSQVKLLPFTPRSLHDPANTWPSAVLPFVSLADGLVYIKPSVYIYTEINIYSKYMCRSEITLYMFCYNPILAISLINVTIFVYINSNRNSLKAFKIYYQVVFWKVTNN